MPCAPGSALFRDIEDRCLKTSRTRGQVLSSAWTARLTDLTIPDLSLADFAPSVRRLNAKAGDGARYRSL